MSSAQTPRSLRSRSPKPSNPKPKTTEPQDPQLATELLSFPSKACGCLAVSKTMGNRSWAREAKKPKVGLSAERQPGWEDIASKFQLVSLAP